MKIYARTNSQSNFWQSNFELMKKFAGTDVWIKARNSMRPYNEYINIQSVVGEYYLGTVTYYSMYARILDDDRPRDLRNYLSLFTENSLRTVESDVRNVILNPNYVYTTQELKEIAGIE